MEKFHKLTSACVPLKIENVDTDQIIPARFLTAIDKVGFGEALFKDWRYRADGTLNPDFVLNDPKYKGHEILVAERNFGCGSSREHAAWGIVQYGFKVVISSLFSDIFRSNSFKNGLLTIQLPDEQVKKIFAEIDKDPEFKLTVDLENQKIIFPTGEVITFEIDQFRKYCLMNGLDDLGYMMSKEPEIVAYEKKYEK